MRNLRNEIYVDSSDNDQDDDNFPHRPRNENNFFFPPRFLQQGPMQNQNQHPNVNIHPNLNRPPNFNFRQRGNNQFNLFPIEFGNNFGVHIPNAFDDIFDNQVRVQAPPEQSIKLKSKIIQLYNIGFTILDVPEKILTYVLKACNASIDKFSLPHAAAYADYVFRQSDKINDNFYERMLLAGTEQQPSTESENFKEETESVVKYIFNEFSLKAIRKELYSNHFLIEPTITNFPVDTRTPMKKPRPKAPYLNINDVIVSVQLDDMFKKAEIKRKKKEKEDLEQLQYETALAEGSLVECECCFCEYPFEWMLQCNDGHLMCKKCVEKQIETAISEGRSNVPCLHFGGCDKMIPIQELERLIPAKTLERLFATETLNAITVADLDHKVKCSKCGYIVLYDGDGPMTCLQCKAQTCPKCGEVAHPDMTCEQFKAIDKDRLVEEQMNEAVVRTCPNCKTQFMKDEGCNKMECPRCHTWICYLCRQVIPKNVGYNHFWRGTGLCPPDKCPLWVKNDKLHIVEAAKAKDDAKDHLAADE